MAPSSGPHDPRVRRGKRSFGLSLRRRRHQATGATRCGATAVPFALLLALLAFHVTVNVVWLATDPDPATNRHSSEHTALLHYLVLKGYPPVVTHGPRPAYRVTWPSEPGRGAGDVEPLLQPFRMATDPGWVPMCLFHLTSVLLACLLGLSYTSMTLAGTVFFVITVGSVYALGRRLGDPWIGLLAAFVVASYPFVFGCPRQYFVYSSTTSMTALAVALLVCSEGLRRPVMAALAAVAISLGMRAGESGTEATLLLVNLAGPLCIAAGLAVRPVLAPRGARSYRGLLGFALFLAVLLPTMGLKWYLTEFVTHTLLLNLRMGGSSDAAVAVSLPRDTLGFYTVHLRELTLVQIRSAPLLLAAMGGIVWQGSDWRNPNTWTLATWILAPTILLSALVQKNPWYLSPILPALAVLTALGLDALRGRTRRIAVGVVVAAGIVQFAWMTAFPNASASAWRTAHRQHMNMAHYAWVPARYDEPTSRAAQAAWIIGDELDRMDPERAGLLTVGLVVPDDLIASSRTDWLLRLDRPQMLTYTLQDPGMLVDRIDEIDLLAYVGEEDLSAGPPAGVPPWLEEAVDVRATEGWPGGPDYDEDEAAALNAALRSWSAGVDETTYQARVSGAVAMIRRNP